MRTILSISVMLAVLTCLAPEPLSSKEPDGRITYLKEPIKVYVVKFVNNTGDSHIYPEGFMERLRNMLSAWKLIEFKVVNDYDSSDVIVSGSINKYRYLVEDPLTTAMRGEGSLDSAGSENYSDIEVEFIVTSSRANNVLWKGTIPAIVKKKMGPMESMSLVFDKVSKIFINNAFGASRP